VAGKPSVRQPDHANTEDKLWTVLLPSVSNIIFIVLFLALSLGALAPAMLGDAGIGWHIRNGQNILSTHAIPHTDSFSATMSGHPWFAWEWLYDALIAFIHNHAGLNGVVSFSAFVIALTFALVFRFAMHRGASLIAVLVFLVPCLAASSIHFLARPHVLGWLFTIVFFWILDSSQRSTFRTGDADPSPILLPLLMILWVNLHGSFVMGFVLLAIYLFADLLTAYRASGDQRRDAALVHVRLVGAVGVLTVLTSLLNPYAYKLHIHVYQYLSNRFLMQHIQEFRSPDFHGLPAQFFVFLVGLTVVVAIWERTKLGWSDWLIIVLSIFSGTLAARNLPVASMLLTIVAAPHFLRRNQPAAPSRFRSLLNRLENLESSLRGHLWPALLVGFTVAVCLNQGRLLGWQMMNAHFSEQRFPVRAVDFLVQSGNREPIFSLDTFGGYLIYRLYPATKVFIDDRHDFYGELYLKDYLKVVHAQPNWQQVLDKWHANLLILPTSSKISDALRESPEWRVTFSDSTATVFERRQ
jgi:hypothetical protein